MTGILVAVLVVLGKIAAYLKEVVLASLFGVSASTDAYFIANLLPGLLWLAILTTVTSVFLPMYVRRMANRTASQCLAVEAVRYYAWLAGILCVCCIVFADQLVLLAAPAAALETRALAVQLTRIMALGFILTGYVGVQSAIQQAHGRFVAPVTVPLVNNLLATLAIVAAWRVQDVRVAVAGAVAAYLVQALVQRWQTRRFYGTRIGWSVGSETWRRLSLLSAPVAVAVLLDQLNLFIGSAFASGFGEGAISHLNYAARLTAFVAGLFSWVVAYLFFPAIAANAGAGDDRANSDVIVRALAIILMTTAPVAAGVLAAREQVVAFLYGRGAFGPADVEVTAALLGFFGLSILFVAVREVLNRVLFSYERTAVPLRIGAVAVALNLTCAYLFTRVMGLPGIALAASVSAAAYCAAQLITIGRWKPELLAKRIWGYFIASTGAALLAYGAGRAVTVAMDGFHPVLVMLACGGAILPVFAVAALLLLRLRGLTVADLAADMVGNRSRPVPGPNLETPML